MIVVAHNLAAMNAQRQFNINDKKKTKNVEKLSSGYKINRAADDAAGLSISEKIRNQVRNLHQAMNNIEDGINFCQVADGALNEVHNILGRIGELAVKAADDVNNPEDREAIDNEVQELKAEMKKIFRTTEFNGRRYWVQPYLPEVEGTPNDVMVFHSDEDKNNGFGGLLINGIRYSWDDLGASFDSEGYFNTGTSGMDKTDYTGELIAWETSPAHTDEDGNVIVEKDMPPNIRRMYRWSAQSDGIYVNNVKAISKDDLLNNPLASTSEGVFYGFEYHGMNVEFMVPNEDLDDWAAISDAINGRTLAGYNNTATWEAYALTPSDPIYDSVKLNGGQTTKQILYISDSWKDNVADRETYYRLDTMASDVDGDGHGDGIRLVDTGKQVSYIGDENDHTKTEWENMSDSTITSAESNGGYPIVDWGTSYAPAYKKDGSALSDVTLNGDATYSYTDNLTGFSFTYNLTDEVSLENMEKELRGANISTIIKAPVATSIAVSTTSVAGAGRLYGGETTMSYALQRDSGISFGSGTSVTSEKFDMHYSVSSFSSRQDILDAETIDLKYDLYNGSNEKLSTSSSISRDILRDLVKNGDSYTFYFSNSRIMDDFQDPSAGMSAEVLDKSVKYSMDYSMTLKVNKLYDEPDYEKVINREYKTAQRTAENNSQDAKNLVDKLLKTEHSDWYERNENGTLSDTIMDEHISDRNSYSTRYIAEAVKDVAADEDGNYSFSYGGHTFRLSQSEKDLLTTWRDTAENKYIGEMETYKTNLDNQYVSVYNMLKNAGLSTKQIEHPTQEVTMSEIFTRSSHTRFDVKVIDAEKYMYIQSGANAGEHTEIRWKNLNLSLIGMNGAETLTRESATNTITKVQNAVNIISAERSKFGSYQNRLEWAYEANANYSENLDKAESNIRDTDMAKEAMDMAKHDILLQAGQSMMAQANQQNQGILQLIQS